MIQKIEFDYFYGTESDSYSFYRIPKQIIVDDRFKSLSNDAKILYGLMLDRMSLSMKNGWFDEENRVFIYYSMEEVMENLNCSKNKALKSLSELDIDTGIGLIERLKQGQGKPTKVYVRNFLVCEKSGSDFPKKEVKTSQIWESRVTKKGSQEVHKKDTNNTKINNIDINNTNSDHIKSMTSYKCEEVRLSLVDSEEIDLKSYAKNIRSNLGIDFLIKQRPYDREVIEGIYELVLETVLNQGDSIVIARNRYPMSLVRSKYLKLNSEHVEYVIGCLKDNTTKVRNIHKYLLAALFNAPSTIGSYYQVEVNHDRVSCE